ncbi:protein mono-ADP-ribosyltransferase PARP14-like [Glandiceps talaboti]
MASQDKIFKKPQLRRKDNRCECRLFMQGLEEDRLNLCGEHLEAMEGNTKWRVLYSYEAKKDDELSTQVDDVICAWKREDGWLYGALGDKEGWFPETYVEAIEDTDDEDDFDDDNDNDDDTSPSHQAKSPHAQKDKRPGFMTEELRDTLDDREKELAIKNATIYVSGCEDILKDEDEIATHFESKRLSGGGPYSKLENHGDHIEIVYESAEVVQRVTSRKEHKVKGISITVRTFEQQNEWKEMEASKARATIIVDGVNENTETETLELYFESRRKSGGGPIQNTTREGSKFRIIYESEKDAKGVIDHGKHLVDGTQLRVQTLDQFRATEDKKEIKRQRTIVVSGVQGLNEDFLQLYFENPRKSGGDGEIEITKRNPDMVDICFESPEVVESVISHGKHTVGKKSLTVTRLRDYEKTIRKVKSDGSVGNKGTAIKSAKETKGIPHLPGQNDMILVTGFGADTPEDVIKMYFESEKHSDGGDIMNIEMKGTEYCSIRFKSFVVAQRVCKRGKHSFGKYTFKVSPGRERKGSIKEKDTVSVTGFKSETAIEIIQMFFENERYSGGGEIKHIEMKDAKTCLITYKSFEVAQRVCQHQNKKFGDVDLKVVLADETSESPEQKKRILVTGFKPGTAEDVVKMYFENKRYSGGGEIEHIEMKDSETYLIEFESFEVAQNVYQQQVHSFGGYNVKVTFEEEVKGKPETITIKGIRPGTAEEGIRMYFENERYSGGGEIKDIEMKDNGAWVIRYESPEVAERVCEHKCHKLGNDELKVVIGEESSEPTAEHDTISVTGLTPGTTTDLIKMYFENESYSGGGDIANVEMIDSRSCLIRFESSEVAKRVCQRENHRYGNATLKVALGTESVVQDTSFEQASFEQGVPKPRKKPPIPKTRVREANVDAIVVVSDFSNTSIEDLEMYFESPRRSGGGTFEKSDLKDGKLFITYESRDVADRVLNHGNHCFQGTTFTVTSMKEVENMKAKEAAMVDATLVISDFKSSTSQESLELYFESNRRSGGGHIVKAEMIDGCLHIIYDSAKVAANVHRRQKHTVGGSQLSVKSLKEIIKEKEKDELRKLSTIVVTKFKATTSKDTLDMYFENERRSGGGPIVDSTLLPNEFRVVFEGPEVASRVLKQGKHTVDSVKLEVRLIGDWTDEQDVLETVTDGATPKSDMPKKRTDSLATKPARGNTVDTSDTSSYHGPDSDSDEDVNCTVEITEYEPYEDLLFKLYLEKCAGHDSIEDTEIKDGVLLVTFKSREAVDRILAEPCHELGGRNMAVKEPKSKLKPNLPKDKTSFFLEGLTEDISKHLLNLLLSKWTGIDEAPELLFGQRTDTALVRYSQEIQDFKTIRGKISSDDVKGHRLKMEYCYCTNSVLVNNLPERADKTFLDLYFSNDRVSGGGDITSINVDKEQKSAVISFQDHRVVNSILQQKKHVICEVSIDVNRYYDRLGCHVSKDGPTLSMPMPISIVMDKVLDFIWRSRQARDELDQTLMSVHARVVWPCEGGNENVQLVPDIQEASQTQQLVRSWPKEASSTLQKYLQLFATVTIPVVEGILLLVEKELENDSIVNERVKLAIDGSSSTVTIVGIKAEVDRLEDTVNNVILKIQKKVEQERSRVSDTWKPDELMVKQLELFHIIDRITDTYPDLKVSIKSRDAVTLEGHISDIKGAKFDMSEDCRRIPKTTYRTQSSALNTFLSHEDVVIRLCDVLASRFDAICAVQDDDLALSAQDRERLDEVRQFLNTFVVERNIIIPPLSLQSVHGEKWKQHIQELHESNTSAVEIKTLHGNQQILVVGFEDAVNTVIEEIDGFMSENTIVEEFRPVENGMVRFLLGPGKERVHTIEKQSKSPSLKISKCERGDRPGFIVSGIQDDVSIASEKLQKEINSVYQFQHPIDQPGMPKLLQEEKGKSYVEFAEKEGNCTIDVTNPLEDVAFQLPEEDQIQLPKPPNPDVLGSCVLQSGKSLIVSREDVTKMPVDVIMTTADKTLKPLGSLAETIADAGGWDVKTECSQVRSMMARAPFVGEVIFTTAGNLPCKKLCHIVDLTASSQSFHSASIRGHGTARDGALLGDAVYSSLEKVNKMKYSSIAIPVQISMGQTLSVNERMEIIIGAVQKYCEDKPVQYLQEIYLVGDSDKQCNAIMHVMKKKCGEVKVTEQRYSTGIQDATFMSLGAVGGEGSRFSQIGAELGDNIPNTNTAKTSEGKMITLVKGSIAKQRVNVLVNSTNNSLDLSQGLVSRALLEEAGPDLQDELNQIKRTGKTAVAGEIITTKGHMLECQYVYHTFCSPWSSSGQPESQLRSTLKKCYEAASQAGMYSIAIPALGTGGLGYPRDVVAKIMFDEAKRFSSKHPKSSLRDINFVVYEKDDKTIQAFENEIQNFSGKKQKQSTIPRKRLTKESTGAISKTTSSKGSLYSDVKVTSRGDLHMEIGNIAVQVQQGDITVETTEAIVNSTNTSMDLLKGAVSKAILNAGGKTVLDETRSLGRQQADSVVMTAAGNLPCSNIIHMIGPHRSVKNSIQKMLEFADQNRIRSIAMPLLGTGVGRQDPGQMADETLEAITEFYQCNTPRFLKLIRVTVFQQDKIKVMEQAMKRRISTSVKDDRGFGQKFMDWLGGSKTQKSPREWNTVILHVFANNKRDVDRAINKLEDLLTKDCLETYIDKPGIEKLDLNRIQDNARQFQVMVEMQSSAYVPRLKLQGMTQDVVRVQNDIQDMLDEIHAEERDLEDKKRLTESVKWVYLDESGAYDDFPDDIMGEIEQAHLSGLRDVTVNIEGASYKIDFSTMTEEDLDDHSKVPVRRLHKEGGVPLPRFWDVMKDDLDFVAIDLDSTSNEYLAVETDFKKSLMCPSPKHLNNPYSLKKIDKIQRIQNPALYRQYFVLKEKMDGKNKVGMKNESALYHGTNEDTVEKINTQGFNRSFAGKNATVYGRGSYFAVNASYSATNTYSPPDNVGKKYVYRAKVLTGDFATGTRDMLVPPPKDQSKPTVTYDSVTNDMNDPEIFVVFNDAVAYPEYLIVFQ